MLPMERMHVEANNSHPRGSARPTVGGTVPNVDIAWLIREFDGLGLKLTATPRLDGSFSLNKWRTISYWDNAARAESLWDEHIGDDQEVISAIATHIAGAGTTTGPLHPAPSARQPS
jgi:hypothetical protein